MPKLTLPWFHTLTDSVSALGFAAREYKAANLLARSASWLTEPARLARIDGEVSVIGRDVMKPHDVAVFTLSDLYGTLESQTKDLYENAAQAYAHGTTAALKAVLEGEQPPHVELARQGRQYAQPSGLLPDLTSALGRWNGHARLAELRERVLRYERARAEADEYAFYEDLSDHECGEITAVSEFAAGLADAAYTYGEKAEGALHFALLGAKFGAAGEPK
jgi:hypothetical protein